MNGEAFGYIEHAVLEQGRALATLEVNIKDMRDTDRFLLDLIHKTERKLAEVQVQIDILKGGK